MSLSPSSNGRRLYELKPLTRHFGALVLSDIDLMKIDLTLTNNNNTTTSQSLSFIEQVKEDLIRHRFVLFRNQSNLSGRRQVEISNALGTVVSTFYKHPKSPHPDIFRVSNDETQGCRNVGRSGWHVDGTFQLQPFAYQTMYFESASQGGDTYFIPLKEFYESLSDNTRQRYDRLWMVTGRRQAPIHPLVYQHPYRHDPTMVFHCGRSFVNGWLMEDEDGNVHATTEQQQIPDHVIQQELTNAIESKFAELGFAMEWQAGDFMINDNLGLVHFASDGTQTDRKQAGLRILHRTTIVGGNDTVPTKIDGRRSFVL